VIVYKRKGKDESIKKVKKPKITPIKINRDAESDFLKQIQTNKPADIQPVFADFKKDLQFLTIKSNIPVTYKENTENKTFDIYYVFEMGSNHDKKMSTAINYLKFLGTSKYTDDQLKEEFYKLGCSFNVSNSADQINVSLTGLSENMEKALQLFETIIADCQPDKEALDNLVKDILKKRSDAKMNQQRVFSTMVAYGMYGKKSPTTNILSENNALCT